VNDCQVLVGERHIRVSVDGQALSGVEQLDQQRRVRVERLDVLRAQPTHRVAAYRAHQQFAIGQPGETYVGLAEQRCRRRDPVLGHVAVHRWITSERRDPPAPA
jgi:hypothetical protein